MALRKSQIILVFNHYFVTLNKLLHLGKKMNDFILFCSRFFVTLAKPKLLALGNAKKNFVFLRISLIIS